MKFSALYFVVGAGLLALGSTAFAEQTIGIQSATGTAAVATAHVNVRVLVPRIVVLRVGAADATISDVNFTVGPTPAVAGAPGNSLPYSGTIPPTMGVTVASTNPTTATGALTVGAWTNGTGATLACSLGAIAGGGATAFATGASAGGVPGTADILVASVAGATNLQHPGASLSTCGGTTSALTQLTTYGGTFTYSTNFAANTIAAGTYGNEVTYTASAP